MVIFCTLEPAKLSPIFSIFVQYIKIEINTNMHLNLIFQ